MRLLNLLFVTAAAGSAVVSTVLAASNAPNDAGVARRGAALGARPSPLNRKVRRHHEHHTRKPRTHSHHTHSRHSHHPHHTHSRHSHHTHHHHSLHSSHSVPTTASAGTFSSKSSSPSWSKPSSSNSGSPKAASSDSSSSSTQSTSSNAANGKADQNHIAGGGDGKLTMPKNGLAWADGTWMDINRFTKTIGWLYSWDVSPVKGQPEAPNYVPGNIQFWPMLWSNQPERTGPWEKYVLNDRNAPQNKAKTAMAFNEVNQAGQADMAPADVCGAMRQYLLPLKYEDDWTIIGPSTNGAPDSIPWMLLFKEMCPDAYDAIDAHSVHYYSTDPHQAIAYFEQFHNTFPDKPIIISEVGCMNYSGQEAPNLGTAYYYVQVINEWAQKTEWVKGLAFYAALLTTNVAEVSRLATTEGSPTGLFDFWVNSS